jgi:hypothetical protein
MVNVVVNASVVVPGGPTIPLDTVVGVESYVFASVDLTATGGSGPSHTLNLLPDGGSVALLAITARDAQGKAAAVTAELQAGASSKSLDVNGVLLVANGDALAAIVATGPRRVVLTNPRPVPITVDVLRVAAQSLPV